MELTLPDDFCSGYDRFTVFPPYDIFINTNNKDTNAIAKNKILEINGTLKKDLFIFFPLQEDMFVIVNNTKGSFKVLLACKGFEKYGTEIEQGYKIAVKCFGRPNYEIKKLSGPEFL